MPPGRFQQARQRADGCQTVKQPVQTFHPFGGRLAPLLFLEAVKFDWEDFDMPDNVLYNA